MDLSNQSPGDVSLPIDSGRPSALASLSRRGFLLAATSLASCAAAQPLKSKPRPPANPAAAAIKTQANTAYRTPAVKRPNAPKKPVAPTAKTPGITYNSVHVAGNYIAMTYDDGPHPQNTPRLLDMLKQRNIKATFYVVGNCVNLYPEIVRRTVAEGHEIGNHSQTHRLLSKLSDDEVRKELSGCRDAIIRAAGVQPRTMRPPYGGLVQRQREWVHAEYGYPVILWSVDPLDWKRPGASVVGSRILAGASQGGIVLAHDLHSQTVDCMPATLDALIARGFKFVTVSQLLAMQVQAPATPAKAPAQP
jgi:peptidoglycan-N-acetylglucosamine deacetylase